jgi:hypothetical protein
MLIINHIIFFFFWIGNKIYLIAFIKKKKKYMKINYMKFFILLLKNYVLSFKEEMKKWPQTLPIH